MQPVQPVRPVQQTQPVRPVQQTQPVRPVQQAQPVRPVQQAAQPVRPAQTQPAQASEPNSIKLGKADEPIEKGVRLEPNELIGTGRKMDLTVDWTCFRCGRSNASYVTTCACGVTKRRAARVYETGIDEYAAQEEEDKKKQEERDKAMEAILEQKSNFGPKAFDSNVVVEVETISRQSPLERKMTNMLYSMVDKAGARNNVPEKEDRLSKYAQNQGVDKSKKPDNSATQTASSPKRFPEPIPTPPPVHTDDDMFDNAPPKKWQPSSAKAAAAPAPAVSEEPIAQDPVQSTNPMFNREPYFDEWRCPDCGTINNDYVSTCSCGCSQRRAKRMNASAGKPATAVPHTSPTSTMPAVTPATRPTQASAQTVTPATRPTQASAPTVAPSSRVTYASAPVTPPPRPGDSTPPKREIPPSPARSAAQQNKHNVPLPNEKPTANVPSTVMSVNTEAPKKNNDREPYFDEWKCPDCGMINNDYVMTCSCGCSQRRAKRLQNKKK